MAGYINWAWCDDNMVTLPVSGLEHGQNGPASATVCVVGPQTKHKHRCMGLAIFMMRNQQLGTAQNASRITSLVLGQHVHDNTL